MTPRSRTPNRSGGRVDRRAEQVATDSRQSAFTSTESGIFAVVGLLSAIGLVMVLSASSVISLDETGSPWSQFLRQAAWTLIAVGVLFVCQKVDYRRWRGLLPVGMAISLVLMVMVLIPGVGMNVNGSSRWLGNDLVRIQPSELVKLVMVLFVADIISRRRHHLDDNRLVFWPIVAVLGIFAALLMFQPNLGTTIILATIVLVMMFVGRLPLAPLGLLVGLLGLLAALFAVFEPYRLRRLTAFADPWADPLNAGFQTIQSQVSLVNGGLLGTGPGESRAKWGFLPEAHTDFIFSIIGEEFGLVGAAVVVGSFLLLGYFGVRTALGAQDRFGTLLATGITVWIMVQAFVNMGAVVGVLPITGVPLPFVSAGGSSLVVTMAAAGLLMNIARGTR